MRIYNYAIQLGFMISCLANSTQIAMALAAPLIIPVMLFGGFFLQNGAVPFYFQCLRYGTSLGSCTEMSAYQLTSDRA